MNNEHALLKKSYRKDIGARGGGCGCRAWGNRSYHVQASRRDWRHAACAGAAQAKPGESAPKRVWFANRARRDPSEDTAPRRQAIRDIAIRTRTQIINLRDFVSNHCSKFKLIFMEDHPSNLYSCFIHANLPWGSLLRQKCKVVTVWSYSLPVFDNMMLRRVLWQIC